MPHLLSKRLRFINASAEVLEKILEGNESLSAYLQINVPDNWTEFGEAPFRYALSKIQSDPGSEQWWSWLPVLIDENILIGNCGYKGRPKDGGVEIGYEVISAYRGIGLATEIAAVLVDNAFNYPEVERVIAHTLPEENASCKVLSKCGFDFVEEVFDLEDGKVWKWEVVRGRFG